MSMAVKSLTEAGLGAGKDFDVGFMLEQAGVRMKRVDGEVGERVGHYVDNRLWKELSIQRDVPPLYAVRKEGLAVVVTANKQDPALYSQRLELEEVRGLTLPGPYTLQIRTPQSEHIHVDTVLQEPFVVVTTEPVWGVAPGQHAVLYAGDMVAGGGTVRACFS
jgi:tRNA U34 2-thiouridine synthase MnmA/TrmU